MSNRTEASRTFYQLLLSSRGEFFFPLRKLKFIAHLLESLAVVGKNPFPGRDEDFYALCSGTGTLKAESVKILEVISQNPAKPKEKVAA